MSKKILVLNGSPRPEGNTAALVSAFVKGAESMGGETVRFELHRMEIHPCLGCYCGGKNEEFPCVQVDGMQEIYTAFQDADVICFASPLYFWTICGQLKVAIDRLFALAECDPDYRYPHKECVLLMAAEGNGFAESLYWYQRLAEHIGWVDRGQVLCGNVLRVGDIAGNTKLDEAFRLGQLICTDAQPQGSG